MKINRLSFDRFFDIAIRVLFIILVIGIPLAFTSYTRSVFEVNKLMVLRYVTLGVCGVWFFRSWLYRIFSVEGDARPAYHFFGFKWAKTGLDIWFLIWILFNIASTVFSQNVRVSVIGAYDRWEGLMTALNYVILLLMTAKLVMSRRTMLWILGAALVATGASAVYGVLQSLGMDFMRWSVDPSQRVFACINNPVHFCAYVAMMVPIGMSFLMFFSSREGPSPKWISVLKIAILVITGLIFYTQFLSFSRATWIGFIGAMPLYYLLVSHTFDQRSSFRFSCDFFATGITMAAFYTSYVFQLHQKGWGIAIPLFVLIGGYLIYSWRELHQLSEESNALSLRGILSFLGTVTLVFFAFILPPLGDSAWMNVLVYGVLWGGFLFLALRLRGAKRHFLGRLSMILVFTLLQFIGLSFMMVAAYTVLAIAVYLLVLRENPNLNPEKRFFLGAFLVIFGALVVIPTLPMLLSDVLKSEDTDSLAAISNAQHKMTTYSVDAIKGSARTSMWKSSFPWIKDYWLIGSGLDTVKYMYPDYRRSEYGILEGGHNFTPDRLHNEYLNNLATRGVLASLVYYLGIIVGWYLIVVRGYFRFGNNPYRYLLAGCVTGATIYLGQVMFNFGVVATMVLFYVLMGLGWALVLHPDFLKEKS
jgi:O-antigen ligase